MVKKTIVSRASDSDTVEELIEMGRRLTVGPAFLDMGNGNIVVIEDELPKKPPEIKTIKISRKK